MNERTNGYRRTSQRQLEKAPEGRPPHSVNHSYMSSNGGVRGAEHGYDAGESAETHTEESLDAPGPAPMESNFTEEL